MLGEIDEELSGIVPGVQGYVGGLISGKGFP
jgi:hypothetical protein